MESISPVTSIVLLGVNERLTNSVPADETALWGFLFGLAVAGADPALASRLLSDNEAVTGQDIGEVLALPMFLSSVNSMFAAVEAPQG